MGKKGGKKENNREKKNNKSAGSIGRDRHQEIWEICRAADPTVQGKASVHSPNFHLKSDYSEDKEKEMS